MEVGMGSPEGEVFGFYRESLVRNCASMTDQSPALQKRRG